ncbi:MAG: phosphonate metabolism protein PhnM [Phototrophicaceae bacterium]
MWLSDLKIVTPDRVIERGAMYFHNGRIEQLLEGDAPAPAQICTGLTAIPGVVDLHGDMIEHDIEPRPGSYFPFGLGLYELDKRLIAAGITTHFAAISFAWKKSELRRQENAIKIIEEIYQQRANLLADIRIHARFEVNNTDTIPVLTELLHAHKLDLVSLMDHTPGQGQYGDVERYINFITTWGGVDADLIAPALREKLRRNIEESAGIVRDWDIAREMTALAVQNGIPVASHDDDTLEKVDKMAELGVTISEFPVTLEAAQEARRRGMHVLMGAPNAYRGQSTSNNLSALECVRLGVVDSLATDYYPAAPLQAAFKLAADGVISLPAAVNLVAKNPADAVNLTDRGRLEVGARADVVLVAEENDYPRVHAVFRDGHPAYWDVFMMRLSRGVMAQLLDQEQ